jgi:hypothetical protein
VIRRTIHLTIAAAMLATAAPVHADPAGAGPDLPPNKLRLDNKYAYGDGRPGVFDWIARVPGDFRDYGKTGFRKDRVPAWIFITASTLVLLPMDQYLVRKAHNLGSHLGITHTAYQKNILTFRVPGTKSDVGFEGPFDSGSALYFLGDGWTDVIIASGFITTGLVTGDNRPLQVASEMGESILASGTIVQVLKHVTGRQSPFESTQPGGEWRFFPNQYTYAHHTPSYDAYPTGHLCAAMATVTVISENYPEHTYIRPVGYTLMTALGFQMLNNGVHWASDYPLGIALGYWFGDMAVKKGKGTFSTDRVELEPFLLPRGGGVTATVRIPAGRKESAS